MQYPLNWKTVHTGRKPVSNSRYDNSSYTNVKQMIILCILAILASFCCVINWNSLSNTRKIWMSIFLYIFHASRKRVSMRSVFIANIFVFSKLCNIREEKFTKETKHITLLKRFNNQYRRYEFRLTSLRKHMTCIDCQYWLAVQYWTSYFTHATILTILKYWR